MRDRALLYFLIFLPLFCGPSQSFGKTKGKIETADSHPESYCPQLKGKRIALIINQTSKAGDSLLLDMLLTRQLDVKKIFVPEHGFRGTEDAGAHINSSTDSATGLPVISLYGAHKQPTAEDLTDVDVMVYDLQDVGVRFYTYISTLQYCMEACARAGVKFMVLDRPNPNGFYVDGPVMEDENKSFVGLQPIPVVYGMTAGEYAQMLVGERWMKAADSIDLQVVKCTNYDHKSKYWLPVAPSPNLRTMAAVYAYPSLCFFEGTSISVGRGTSLPFQQYGAPALKGKYEYYFVPKSGPGAKSPQYDGDTCYGELIGATAQEVLSLTDGHLHLNWLQNAYVAYPDKEKFFNAFFVRLSGTNKLKEQIIKNEAISNISDSWQKDLDLFKSIRKKYLLYEDF